MGVCCQFSVTVGHFLLYIKGSATLFLLSQQIFFSVIINHNYFVRVNILCVWSHLNLSCLGLHNGMAKQVSVVKKHSMQFCFSYTCTTETVHTMEKCCFWQWYTAEHLLTSFPLPFCNVLGIDGVDKYSCWKWMNATQFTVHGKLKDFNRSRINNVLHCSKEVWNE